MEERNASEIVRIDKRATPLELRSLRRILLVS